jgi:transposase
VRGRLLAGDPTATSLTDWYKRYRHLKVWADDLRGKLLRRCTDLYRVWANEIMRRYALIGLENMDISEMARTKRRGDGSENELHDRVRAQRVLACAHQLRAEVETLARQTGSRLSYRTAFTTKRCRSCGKITEPSDRAKLRWVCEHCGAEWDQDDNSAGNLLDIAISGGGSSKPRPKKRAGRWGNEAAQGKDIPVSATGRSTSWESQGDQPRVAV